MSDHESDLPVPEVGEIVLLVMDKQPYAFRARVTANNLKDLGGLGLTYRVEMIENGMAGLNGRHVVVAREEIVTKAELIRLLE